MKSAQLAFGAPWIFSFLLLAACGPRSDCPTCDDSSGTNSTGTGSQSCTSTRGTLEGTAYLQAPPSDPRSSPAAEARIKLRRLQDDTPIYAKADAQGKFRIEIEADTWLVSSDEPGGCVTEMTTEVVLEACEVEKLDLILDACSG